MPPGPGICLGGWPAKHVAAVACSATGPPELIGRIPGPRAEAQFRRALSISQGDWTVFFTDTLALALLLIAALALLGPFLWRLLGGRRQIRAA